jgi:deoxyribodipyrimidine photolyase-related protein
MTASRRWLFADQLGPNLLDDPEQPVLLIEAKSVFRQGHRQKAHLVLSAIRHRAAELGDRCTFVQADTYGEALDTIGGTLTVCHPTSRAARSLVTRRADVRMLPPRGLTTGPEEFVAWAHERTHLRMDDFYRGVRRRLNVLMDGDQPIGGRWSWDADNRQPPPRTGGIDVAPPVLPVEDGIDGRVRADLDQWERDGVAFIGPDGPRLFPATGAEAKARLDDFIGHRLAAFGPFEDAMLAGDPFLAHSTLSAPLNLGLLDPRPPCAEAALRRGAVLLSSAEGFDPDSPTRVVRAESS